MAKIYPREVSKNSPRSEIKVRERLSSIQDISALHSVAWQSLRNNRQADGEADFIIILPHHGLLILEVKGGGVEVINGTWHSTGKDGIRHPIKNPFDQAKESKYALLKHFENTQPSLKRIPVVHAVAFPDITVSKTLGINAPREIVIDRNDLDDLMNAMVRVFNHWGQARQMSFDEQARIIDLLAPTIEVRRLMCDEVRDADNGLIELTSEQFGVLQMARRMKKAAILGGAGTGKTILAIEKAKQLAESGFKTLLVCYNNLLRKYLVQSLEDTAVDVQSFHTLTYREAKNTGLPVPRDADASWFEDTAPRVLAQAIEANRTKYDALLIDEAQDFSIEWLNAVFEILDEDGILYIFADSHQDLYRRGWKIPKELPTLDLTCNCRNTRPIAQRVANVYGDVLIGKMIEGPPPTFIEVDRPEQFTSHVCNLVETLLLKEKLLPEQLIILSNSTPLITELRTTGAAGRLFTTFEGHGISTETISRFKGLEREAVILVLTDGASQNLLPLSYVGLSRAKVGLYVIAHPDIYDKLELTSNQSLQLA